MATIGTDRTITITSDLQSWRRDMRRGMDYLYGHISREIYQLQRLGLSEDEMERFQAVQLGIERRWCSLMERRRHEDQ